MNDAEIEFVEQFGLNFEEDGLPRIAGRIFGLLLLRKEPLMLDDLAETLQVSKASISTNTRLLNRMEMVDRTSKPGDRRAFYRLAPDAFDRSFDRVKKRMSSVIELLEETIPALPEENEAVLSRLRMMRDWHLFLVGEMDELLLRWKNKSIKTGEQS